MHADTRSRITTGTEWHRTTGSTSPRHRYASLGVLVLGLALAMPGLPALVQAQETIALTDFRGRSGLSVEEFAAALFPAPASPTPLVRTRGIGAPQTLPSLPTPRAAVTLNVLFASNSEVIPSTSYAEIDKLGTVLSWPQYSDYRIQLGGHTDSQGPERKNQALSEKRVQSIKDYLVQRFQITPERVRAVGYGASKPLASNDTPEGRSQNRRVEVVNLGRGL
jgi:outer membrane protein OmpA-like peptidoglycan-associated protein